MRLFSHKERPVHLGPYPLERLKRSATIPRFHSTGSSFPVSYHDSDNPLSMSNAMIKVAGLFDRLRDGEVAPDLAPIPEEPGERAAHLKAASYYLDASMAAVAQVPESAILENPVRVQLLDDSGEVHYSAGASENKMAQWIRM